MNLTTADMAGLIYCRLERKISSLLRQEEDLIRQDEMPTYNRIKRERIAYEQIAERFNPVYHFLIRDKDSI